MNKIKIIIASILLIWKYLEYEFERHFREKGLKVNFNLVPQR